MAKTHLRGTHISFEEKQRNPYLLKYENFHSACGYLQLAKPNKKSYTTKLDLQHHSVYGRNDEI